MWRAESVQWSGQQCCELRKMVWQPLEAAKMSVTKRGQSTANLGKLKDQFTCVENNKILTNVEND